MDLSHLSFLPPYAAQWLQDEFGNTAASESSTFGASGSSSSAPHAQYGQSYSQAPTTSYYPPFAQSALRAEHRQSANDSARTSSQPDSGFGSSFPSQAPIVAQNSYQQISGYPLQKHSDLRTTENTPMNDTSQPESFYRPSPSRDVNHSQPRQQLRRHRIRAHVDQIRGISARPSRRERTAPSQEEQDQTAKLEAQSPHDINMYLGQGTQNAPHSSPMVQLAHSNQPYEEVHPPVRQADTATHQVPSTPVFPQQHYGANHWDYHPQRAEPSPELSSTQSQSPLSPSTLTPPIQTSTTASSTTLSTPAPQQLTVFIHTNLPRERTTADEASEDYAEYRHHFPQDTEAHRKFRVAMHDIMHSQWKDLNDLEPTSAVLLQFSKRSTRGDGVTIYKCLLHHQGKACTKSWNRSERMLAHIRRVINLRPFACEGDGQLCNCGARFFAEDTLQQHRKNTQAVACQYCHASVTPRNIKRHQRSNCPITTANRANPQVQPQ